VGESYELDAVDWISAGAVGQPGQRSFYVQAKQGSEFVALLVEKGQVSSLARLAQEMLSREDITVTPDDLDESAQRVVDPPTVAWRSGSMRLGADPDAERYVLEAEEVTEGDPEEEGDEGGEEAATARFWMSREQLVALAAYAAYAVESGARESCQLCNNPIDPVEGHICPALNGHRDMQS
jgi:uncharacterized repeat protein (TIGR03847 family)